MTVHDADAPSQGSNPDAVTATPYARPKGNEDTDNGTEVRKPVSAPLWARGDKVGIRSIVPETLRTG
jgi:hypothetical protein